MSECEGQAGGIEGLGKGSRCRLLRGSVVGPWPGLALQGAWLGRREEEVALLSLGIHTAGKRLTAFLLLLPAVVSF